MPPAARQLCSIRGHRHVAGVDDRSGEIGELLVAGEQAVGDNLVAPRGHLVPEAVAVGKADGGKTRLPELEEFLAREIADERLVCGRLSFNADGGADQRKLDQIGAPVVHLAIEADAHHSVAAEQLRFPFDTGDGRLRAARCACVMVSSSCDDSTNCRPCPG